MLFMGGGLGLVQAPATEAIMGSLPPAKAGVGSAVNDTARELGGTLGVAIVGSVFSSIYAVTARRRPRRHRRCPTTPWRVAKESVGAAKEVARQAGATAGPEAEAFVTDAVEQRLRRRLARRLVGVGRRRPARRPGRLALPPGPARPTPQSDPVAPPSATIVRKNGLRRLASSLG